MPMPWQRLVLPGGMLVLAVAVLVTVRHGLLGAAALSSEAGAVPVVNAEECDSRPTPRDGCPDAVPTGVRVRVLIDTLGDVLDASLVAGSGDAGRDSSVLRQARAMVFSRPFRRGRSVLCVMELEGDR